MRAKRMTLKDIAGQITCPIWLGSAEDDQFFKGQPEMVKEGVGERGTYVKPTVEDGASAHCHVGASVRMNQLIFDWFQETVVEA